MLCKLAWGNVRRAGRDYLVYLLTLTTGVTVFYAFNTISMQVDIAGIDEEGLAQVMGSMLGYLTYFLAGVMAFLMVYANNFIMKRRKKEFGLYRARHGARARRHDHGARDRDSIGRGLCRRHCAGCGTLPAHDVLYGLAL